jgi:hypothetical protein
MISVLGTGQAKETEAVRLPPQLPSNLPWAANGAGGPESGHRLAQSMDDPAGNGQ